MIPKLRFPQFTDEWQVKKIEEVFSIRAGQGFKASEYSKTVDVPLLQIENVKYGYISWDNYVSMPLSYLDEYPHLHLKEGDIVLALNRPVTNGQLKIAVLKKWDEPSILYQRVGKITVSEDNSKGFIYYLCLIYIKRHVLRQSLGSDQPFISVKSLYKDKIATPTKDEQERIAEFLTTVDERIALMEKKLELLKKYKKGVMQKIFTQQIRFKDENGDSYPDWEVRTLNEIAERVTERNKDDAISFALTNSATDGVVSQTEYFEKDIANKGNLTNYYVVSVDDFVYNPRISVHAPVGPIKRNHLKKGVMSPLYTVFRFKDGLLDFFEHYFETKGWHEYLKSVANSGARHDRMNITTSDFYEMPLPFPVLEEQRRIVIFLNTLNTKIALENRRLKKAKDFKKSLLQGMFV